MDYNNQKLLNWFPKWTKIRIELENGDSSATVSRANQICYRIGEVVSTRLYTSIEEEFKCRTATVSGIKFCLSNGKLNIKLAFFNALGHRLSRSVSDHVVRNFNANSLRSRKMSFPSNRDQFETSNGYNMRNRNQFTKCENPWNGKFREIYEESRTDTVKDADFRHFLELTSRSYGIDSSPLNLARCRNQVIRFFNHCYSSNQ